jgi:hypothetical protein
VSPEVQADIELACGQAKGGAWWRYHMNTDTALNFAGCTLEAIQSFKVRSKHYLHDVSMGGRVVVADQRTLTCEYAGRMQVCRLSSPLLSPSPLPPRLLAPPPPPPMFSFLTTTASAQSASFLSLSY